MAKLRVKVDDSPLHSGHSVRGMGFYTRNLIEALRENNDIELVEDNNDIIHYPYFDLFANTLKPDYGKKVVVTVADVIPLLYPKIYKPGVRGKLNFLRQKKALQKVDAVVTISETSKKDIVRLLDIPAENVYVTLLGPGNAKKPASRKVKLDLPEEYVLYVGDINWNKNIINFVKAVNKAKTNAVIVGKQAKELLDHPASFDFSHPQLAHLKELYQILSKSKNIYVLGYLEDEKFAAAYNQASIYCQPSFYEGFGLPLLEAMQSNIPIVAAKTQALVEVAENSAVYADPYSVDELASALLNVMKDKDLSKKLVQNGQVRIKEFSWKRAAQETINVYKLLV